MHPSIESLLADIERLSGRPVLVQEDPSLTQAAAISDIAPAWQMAT